MDQLLKFAYAPKEALDPDSLVQLLQEGDGRGMFALPSERIDSESLVRVQQELRVLLEMTADGESPSVTVRIHQFVAKRRWPVRRRLTSHYMLLVTGPARDLTLALAGRLLSTGRGRKLVRCAICRRVFQARRSTATVCGSRQCEIARDQRNWRQWKRSSRKRKLMLHLERR